MGTILYILLALGYFVALLWLCNYVNNKQTTPIPKKWMLAAMAAKVVAGVIYGYLYAHYFPVSDSWAYFEESLLEYEQVKLTPIHFFSPPVTLADLHILSNADDAFWSNLGENILIKLLVLFNFLSLGNYYVNVVLFNFLPFLGLLLLYHSLVNTWVHNHKLLYGLIFFFPSVLFWNSGIDKDGLIVLGTGLFIWGIGKLYGKWRPGYLICAVLGFVFTLAMRSVNALVFLLPVLLFWVLKVVKRKSLAFVFSLIIVGCCFFATNFLPQQYQLPQILADKQASFLAKKGNSLLTLPTLEPTIYGYLNTLPFAVKNIFIEPVIYNIRNPLYLMSFLEVGLFWGMVLYTLLVYWRKQVSVPVSYADLSVMQAALLLLLIVGITVPFLGAIVRYKSFYWMLLLLPLAKTWPRVKYLNFS